MKNEPTGYSWDSFSEETKTRIQEKKQYERRLNDLLEDIRQAALGMDYQTKVHLKMIEKRVISKLVETEIEIKKIVKEHVNKQKLDSAQGTLFDD